MTRPLSNRQAFAVEQIVSANPSLKWVHFNHNVDKSGTYFMRTDSLRTRVVAAVYPDGVFYIMQGDKDLTLPELSELVV